MNPEFPPLRFREPQIKSRRRERRGFVTPVLIPAAERREISRQIREQTAEIDWALRERTPDERRAIFLRLKHDRPLTRKDLAGTGLTFMSAPGADESLVVTRQETLELLEKRLDKFTEGEEPLRPKGTDFATSVRAIELGEPKGSDASATLARDTYARMVQQQHGRLSIGRPRSITGCGCHFHSPDSSKGERPAHTRQTEERYLVGRPFFIPP